MPLYHDCRDCMHNHGYAGYGKIKCYVGQNPEDVYLSEKIIENGNTPCPHWFNWEYITRLN